MTAALRELPRQLLWAATLGVVGRAVTAPVSPPDGTGMQWDELVLSALATSCAVSWSSGSCAAWTGRPRAPGGPCSPGRWASPSPRCWPAPSRGRRSTASASTTCCSSPAPAPRWSPPRSWPGRSSAPDFRGLVEAGSDGVAIMDAQFRLPFVSPAARTLLGIGDDDPDVVLLDLVVAEDREPLRRSALDAPVGEGPPMQFRVPVPDGPPRELEVTSSDRPGSTQRVLHRAASPPAAGIHLLHRRAFPVDLRAEEMAGLLATGDALPVG